jgi:hypothetical protein
VFDHVAPFIVASLLLSVRSYHVVPDPGYDTELEASKWTNRFEVMMSEGGDGGSGDVCIEWNPELKPSVPRFVENPPPKP